MEISIKRVKAMVRKEIRDFARNINVSLMCLLPVTLVLLLSNVQESIPGQSISGSELLSLGLNTNFLIVSTFAISMLIAEEKEKNTMRTLMLSSVTPLEFLFGKIVVIMLFSLLTNIAIFFIAGIGMAYLSHFVFWSLIVTLIMMLIGGIIGLIADNQMSTSVLGMPVIFLFMILPMLSESNETLRKIASLFPNHNFNMILKKIMDGNGYADTASHIFLILGALAVTVILFVYTYNRKSLDK